MNQVSEKEQDKIELTEEIKKQGEFESLANSLGGKRLLKSLQSEILGVLDGLCMKYKELPHIELIALLARLSERLEIYRTLNGASKKKRKARELLEEILKT